MDLLERSDSAKICNSANNYVNAVGEMKSKGVGHAQSIIIILTNSVYIILKKLMVRHTNDKAYIQANLPCR